MDVPFTEYEVFREQALEAVEHERKLERYGHGYRSQLTLEDRACWRILLPGLLGLYAELHYHSRRRGRFKPGEEKWLEHCFVNWDRCSQEQLEAISTRLHELAGLCRADQYLRLAGLGS